MLRPSRPMMRPFMSSLGRSTTDTVVSMACSAALRWMASVTICRARAAACSRASASSRLTSVAASRRASDSICSEQEVARFVGGEPGDALQLALLIGDEPLVSCGGLPAGLFAVVDLALATPQVLLETVGGGEAIGERLRLLGEPLLGVHGRLRHARAPAARRPRAARAPFPWPRAGLPSRLASASRSVSRSIRLASCSARPTVSAAMRLRLASQYAKTAPAATRVKRTSRRYRNGELAHGVSRRTPWSQIASAWRRRAGQAAPEKTRVGQEWCSEESPRVAVWGGR
jgi:hypothetical protein